MRTKYLDHLAQELKQVQRNRKDEPCHRHHRFENGARFEWVSRFAAVTSGLPTMRELSHGRPEMPTATACTECAFAGT
jgi:hypothetical protein